MSEDATPEEPATVQDVIGDLERKLGITHEEAPAPDVGKALGFLEMAENFINEAGSQLSSVEGLTDELTKLGELRDQLRVSRTFV